MVVSRKRIIYEIFLVLMNDDDTIHNEYKLYNHRIDVKDIECRITNFTLFNNFLTELAQQIYL